MEREGREMGRVRRRDGGGERGRERHSHRQIDYLRALCKPVPVSNPSATPLLLAELKRGRGVHKQPGHTLTLLSMPLSLPIQYMAAAD